MSNGNCFSIELKSYISTTYSFTVFNSSDSNVFPISTDRKRQRHLNVMNVKRHRTNETKESFHFHRGATVRKRWNFFFRLELSNACRKKVIRSIFLRQILYLELKCRSKKNTIIFAKIDSWNKASVIRIIESCRDFMKARLSCSFLRTLL